MELFGIEVDDLETNAMPVDVIVFVKALDGNGDPTLYRRQSDGLGDFELLGILMVEVERLRDYIAGCFVDEDEPEDDD